MRVKAAFEVPTKDLGPCIEIRRGISWSLDMERELSSEKTWPVIRIPNVQEVLDTTDLVHLAGIPLGAAQVHKATRGWTIMVGSNGNPERVGNAVFIRKDEGYLFASFLVGITPAAATDLDPAYLYRYINSPAIQQAITDSVAGTTGLKNISLKELAKLPLPDISISEQRLIAKILDTVDEAIRVTERLIEKLKALKAGLLYNLLTRGIDENGRLRDPIAHSEQFKNCEVGLIPTTWRCVRLAAVVPTSDYGISTALNDIAGVPVLRMNNLAEGEVDLAELRNSTGAVPARLWLKAGDVLFNRTNSMDHVGRTGIWRGQIEKATFASYLVRLNPDRTALNGEFLNQWLNWPITQIAIRRFATPGVHQVNINPTSLGRTLLALPELAEQREVVRVLSRIRQRISAEAKHLQKLQALKQGLMHDLLTGKVRIPIDEEDDDE